MPMAAPIIPSMIMITTKIIIATMLISNAFSQPQSKKCFTSAKKIISIIIEPSKEPIVPVKSQPIASLITTPIATVHIASVNFALCFPTSILPDSHKTGERMTTLMIMLMMKPSMSIFSPKTEFSISVKNFAIPKQHTKQIHVTH